MFDDALALYPLNAPSDGNVWESGSRCDRIRVRVGMGLLAAVALVATVYGFVGLAQAFAEKDAEARKAKFYGAGMLLSLVGIPVICGCLAAIACTKREADNPQIIA